MGAVTDTKVDEANTTYPIIKMNNVISKSIVKYIM